MLDSARGQKCASESPEKQQTTQTTSNMTPTTTTTSTSMYNSGKPSSKSLNGSYKNLSDTTPDHMQVDNHDDQGDVLGGGGEFEGIVHRDTKNFATTMRLLDAMRKNRHLCDLVLQLDNDSQDIYCHQIILACNSKFFMEIFTNYEREHQDVVTISSPYGSSNIERSSGPNSSGPASTNGNGSSRQSPGLIEPAGCRKKSVVELVNRNKNSTHTQLLFCLSDYLRNFLHDSHHHHNAKLNTAINHNSHYHHHHHHHPSNLTYNVDPHATNQCANELNHNLDYEALKLCIDYMYTGKLRVPSYLIPHVYTLAYHLSFENIVQLCANYLSAHLNVDNCLSIRSFALDEKLIDDSTQCIEKNIEYILQINPKGMNGTTNGSTNKLSSSLSSLTSTKSTNGGGNGVAQQLENSSSLSCSINLAHNEFNHLPRINIELVGLGKFALPNSLADITTMCMNWLVDVTQTRKTHTLNDLCDNLNLLFMNSIDHTLHDCCEMDISDVNFNDYIDDYQKKHHIQAAIDESKQQNNSTSSQQSSLKIKAFKITDQDMNDIGKPTPIRLKTMHENEVVCTYQMGVNCFVAICTLSGKLVSLSVHLLQNSYNGNGTDNLSNSGNSLKWNVNGAGSVFDSLSSPNGLKIPEIEQVLNDARSTCSDTDSPTMLTSGEWEASSNNTQQPPQASPAQLKLPKMQVPRCSHGLVAHENKLYIIGGYDRGECISTCECYDPKTNTISEMRGMQNRRGRAAIAWLESERSIYVMGGSDGHTELNSIERYDMSAKKWSTIKLDVELQFTNLGVIACRNFIYLVGVKQDGQQPRTCCLKFEPKTNSFARLAELNHGRSQTALVLTYTKNDDYFIYAFGGYDQNKCLSTCEVYNVQDDKWSLIPSMYEARRGCGAAFHEKTQSVFIVGGTNGSKSLKSVEIYDIVGKKWTSGPELNIARTNVSIAFIGDILFAVGGFDGKSFMRTIEYLNCNNLSNGWSLFYNSSDFDLI